jgi:ribosomal protein S18 acetylase RimI-like enzyme
MPEVPEAYGFYCLGITASDSKELGQEFGAEIAEANDYRQYIPFVYVHYIAVRQEFQNQRIGTMLLGNMMQRCGHIVRNVGVLGIALHALTTRALKLYEGYGFRQFNELRYPLMVLPTQSLIDLTSGQFEA